MATGRGWRRWWRVRRDVALPCGRLPQAAELVEVLQPRQRWPPAWIDPGVRSTRAALDEAALRAAPAAPAPAPSRLLVYALDGRQPSLRLPHHLAATGSAGWRAWRRARRSAAAGGGVVEQAVVAGSGRWSRRSGRRPRAVPPPPAPLPRIGPELTGNASGRMGPGGPEGTLARG